MKVCPEEAIYRGEKAVLISEEKCIGCRACIDACPFGAILIDSKTLKPIKCDLCNGNPACVTVCPKDAIKYNRIEVLPKIKMLKIHKKEVKR